MFKHVDVKYLASFFGSCPQIRIWLHIPAVMQHIIPFRTYVIRWVLSKQVFPQPISFVSGEFARCGKSVIQSCCWFVLVNKNSSGIPYNKWQRPCPVIHFRTFRSLLGWVSSRHFVDHLALAQHQKASPTRSSWEKYSFFKGLLVTLWFKSEKTKKKKNLQMTTMSDN